MEDHILFRVSLGTVFVGFLLLYLLSETLPVPQKAVQELSGEDLGGTLTFSGRILSVSEGQTIATLSVGQETPVQVVAFKKNNQSLGFSEGDYVRIVGQVAEYQGRVQIVADEIRTVE